MKALLSNQSGTLFGYLAGRFPGYIGNLFSIDGNFHPWAFAPYALDNGAYPAWKNGTKWDEVAWLRLLDRAARCPMQPEWVLVPDVVTNREATLEAWGRWLPEVVQRGLVPAFAVQDGMTADDVPGDAKVLFVGGSTEWKWQTVPMWCSQFRRVHVGRVNYINQLEICYQVGAESTDGTGWFRGDDSQLNGLVRFYEALQQNPHNLTRSLFKYRDAAERRAHQLRMF